MGPASPLLLLACPATTTWSQAPRVDPPVRIVVVEASPRGSKVALGCADGTLRIVDASTGEVERTLRFEAGIPSAFAFSPKGGRLAVGVFVRPDPDGRCELAEYWRWRVLDLDSASQTVTTRIADKRGWRSSASFSADDRRLLVWAEESTEVFDAVDGKSLLRFGGWDAPITCAAWADTTDQIVTGGADGSIRLWRSGTGEPLALCDVGERTACVAVSPDGRRLFSGSTSSYVRRTTALGSIWSLPTLTFEREFRPTSDMLFDDSIISAQWSSDGERIVCTTGPWHTMEGRARDGRLLWMTEFNGGAEEPLLASFDPSGTYSACWRGRMNYSRVFDGRTGECRLDLRQISKYSGDLTWTADGRHLVYVDPDGLGVVEVPSFRTVRGLRVTRSGVESIEVK